MAVSSSASRSRTFRPAAPSTTATRTRRSRKPRGARIWSSRRRQRPCGSGSQDNSTLEIFTMPDGGNMYSSFTIKVATWPNGTHSSKGPDGNDWLTKLASFPNFAVTGGVERLPATLSSRGARARAKAPRAGSTSRIARPRRRTGSQDEERSSARCRSRTTTTPSRIRTSPSMGGNEVGVILGWGGKNDHANCAMGIIGDFVVWFQNGSTRTVQRFGDYLTTRRGRRPAPVRWVRLLRDECHRRHEQVHVSTRSTSATAAPPRELRSREG